MINHPSGDKIYTILDVVAYVRKLDALGCGKPIREARSRQSMPLKKGKRTMNRLHSRICLAIWALSVPCLSLACESAVNVRDPQCAKHPPPVAFRKISSRMIWTVYYDSTSGKCITFDAPSEGTVTESGAKDFEDFKERFTPFSSIEECMAVCNEPQSCDANNPCPAFEYSCSSGVCEMYPQTCVEGSSDGGGFCTLQCQAPGAVARFGWGYDAICPDGFTCTDEACVLTEP